MHAKLNVGMQSVCLWHLTYPVLFYKGLNTRTIYVYMYIHNTGTWRVHTSQVNLHRKDTTCFQVRLIGKFLGKVLHFPERFTGKLKCLVLVHLGTFHCLFYVHFPASLLDSCNGQLLYTSSKIYKKTPLFRSFTHPSKVYWKTSMTSTFTLPSLSL